MIEFWDYLSQFLAVAAGFCAALRVYLKSRRQPWFLLTCFYGTFALGTLYWTLHLLLRQETPQVFYVSDLAWLASYVFLLALTLTLMTFGERALWYAVNHFHLPEWMAALWVHLRFPAAGAVSFFALLLLYALAQDTLQPMRNIWPGTLFSLAAWMVVSGLYSYYANHFSHYSLLYGSIGAIIVVLIWLNLTAVTLILGAEVNGVLISMRKDRLTEQ